MTLFEMKSNEFVVLENIKSIKMKEGLFTVYRIGRRSTEPIWYIWVDNECFGYKIEADAFHILNRLKKELKECK